MLRTYHYLYFVVRLTGGPTKYEGRVEVYHNNKWSKVCHNNNGWDLNTAQVVCNELGYGRAIAARNLFFARRQGVWLDDLKCVGTEWTIRNCLHKGFQNCRYYYVAGVQCAAG